MITIDEATAMLILPPIFLLIVVAGMIVEMWRNSFSRAALKFSLSDKLPFYKANPAVAVINMNDATYRTVDLDLTKDNFEYMKERYATPREKVKTMMGAQVLFYRLGWPTPLDITPRIVHEKITPRTIVVDGKVVADWDFNYVEVETKDEQGKPIKTKVQDVLIETTTTLPRGAHLDALAVERLLVAQWAIARAKAMLENVVDKRIFYIIAAASVVAAIMGVLSVDKLYNAVEPMLKTLLSDVGGISTTLANSTRILPPLAP